MKKEDAQDVLYRIEAEGFDYSFDGYSNWKEIKDEKFHDIRLDYLDAKNRMMEYLKSSV